MEFSRRHFLGAGSALAAAGLMSAAGQASAQTAKVPAKWDETVDFLIVGTGFAGLAAALEAHQIGIKNVLVIDKMPTPGGQLHHQRRCCGCCRHGYAEEGWHFR